MKKYIFKVTKTQNKQINKSKNQIKYFNNNKRAKFKTSNRINNKENQDNLLNEKKKLIFVKQNQVIIHIIKKIITMMN